MFLLSWASWRMTVQKKTTPLLHLPEWWYQFRFPRFIHPVGRNTHSRHHHHRFQWQGVAMCSMGSNLVRAVPLLLSFGQDTNPRKGTKWDIIQMLHSSKMWIHLSVCDTHVCKTGVALFIVAIHLEAQPLKLYKVWEWLYKQIKKPKDRSLITHTSTDQ